MLDLASQDAFTDAVRAAIQQDSSVLDELRADVRPLKAITRRIQPYRSTAVSLVGTDGGNNSIEYDPFLVQLIRVVDSSNNEYCQEAITPSTSNDVLDRRHFSSHGKPISALGRMAHAFDLDSVGKLSPVTAAPLERRSPSWVGVYRELTEWAVLLDVLRTKDFGTDTVIVFDGFLRSKIFSKGLFGRYQELLYEAIEGHYNKNRRRLYIAGVAKHSKFLQKYRLAFALEGVMRNAYPCYVVVPEELEQKAYNWSEYVTGGGSGEGFSAGSMCMTKFGSRHTDPIWAIDILKSQADQVPTILGYLLEDAKEGFPIPFYPQCLQRAHENAALVGLDMAILQDQVRDAIRETLQSKGSILDELALQAKDPSAERYND